MNVVSTNSTALELLTILRSELERLNLSREEKQSAEEHLAVIETQIQLEKPSKSVISTMIKALPHIESITTIATSLLSIF